MTDDNCPQPLSPIASARATNHAPANSSAPALVAPLTAMIKLWHGWFRGVADEIANNRGNDHGPDFDHELNNAQGAGVHLWRMDAAVPWNDLNTEAQSNGVAFSIAAKVHHRAALLDALDDPFAPTPLTHRQLTFVQPIDEDGYPDTSPAHPAARALYRLKSRQYPALYPPERNDWTAAQWREHGHRQYADWLAKCSPAARAQLTAWATRINAQRDAATCTTSWRAPGHHGPRRRSGYELV
jgi:hypothetical protein